MRALVISAGPWNDKNSFGNSFSSIFSGMKDIQFANVYCGVGSPENEFDMQCFQITPSSLIRNLKDRTLPTGQVVENHSAAGVERTAQEQKSFDAARTLRWQVLFWARDFLWKIGRWNSPELTHFLDDFQPDIIFTPVYYSSYMNDITQFAKAYTGVPMVGYISDDCYTLKQLRFSPLYWIDRLWKRQKVKKTINLCDILYVISDIQKQEYEPLFNPPCKILTKCAHFPERVFTNEINRGEITLMYGGNIGSGRWKSLGLLAAAVERLNHEGYAVRLDIYSGTPCTKAMNTALKKDGCYLHKPIPYTELLQRQQAADVLVHVEGLSLKSRWEVRQSFSTKIVDFFEMGKCIFAVGTADVASINHLINHDAAVVAQSADDVYEKLCELLRDPQQISIYGEKAYRCGMQYHSRDSMQAMLWQDMEKTIDRYNKKSNPLP